MIDLDNNTITYSGKVMDRRKINGTTGNYWCDDSATITYSSENPINGIKGVIIDASACANNTYYAYFDNMKLYSTHTGYVVNATNSASVSLTASETAVAGASVSLGVETSAGYGTPVVSVTNVTTGEAVSYDSANSTFTMPESDVTVKAYAPWVGTGVKELNTDFDNTTMFTTSGSTSVNASGNVVNFSNAANSIADGYVAFTAPKTGKIDVTFKNTYSGNGTRYARFGIFADAAGTNALQGPTGAISSDEGNNTSVLSTDVIEGTTYYLAGYKYSDKYSCPSQITSIVFTPQSYAIKEIDTDSADVSVASTAMEGDKVTVTATPKTGYTTPVTITVTNNTTGDPISVDANNQFVMPDSAVTVTATATAVPVEGPEKLVVTYKADETVLGTAEYDISSKNVDDTYYYGVPKYVIKDNKLYEAAKMQKYNDSYYINAHTVTTDTTNTVTANYSAKAVTGTPVYFADFGTLSQENATSTNSLTQTMYKRSSGGSWTSDSKSLTLVPANTLSDGIYTIEIVNNRNRNAAVKVGDTTIGTLANGENGGTVNTTTFTKVVVRGGAAITAVKASGQGATDNIDYILVTKTADIVGSFVDQAWDNESNTTGFTVNGNILTDENDNSVYAYSSTFTTTGANYKMQVSNGVKSVQKDVTDTYIVEGSTVRFFLITDAVIDKDASYVYTE